MAASSQGTNPRAIVPAPPNLAAALQRGSSNRGFASMDPERQPYVGADASRASQASGTSRDADRKGGAMPGTIGSGGR